MIEEREYWLKRLSIEGQFPHLLPDYKRPSVFSSQTDALDLTLSADITARLMRLAGGSDFLIYTAFLTAMKICLHKYTGAAAIPVGSPARKRGGGVALENALVIVDILEEHYTVKQLLLNVRETLLGAYARQRYPFTRLLRELGFDRIANKCPLFDVALAFQSIHYSLPEVKNDLTITFTRDGERLIGIAEFRSSLFAKRTIRSFCDSLLYILQQMLEDSNAQILNLSLLTSLEREQCLSSAQEDVRPLTIGGQCSFGLEIEPGRIVRREQRTKIKSDRGKPDKVEDVVVRVWTEALRLETVGGEDNFFELGGNSLLATRVVTRLSDIFQAEIKLLMLFSAPVLRDFSILVEVALRESRGAWLPRIRVRPPASGEKVWPLSFAQQFLWSLHQSAHDGASARISTAVRLKGPLNLASLEQSIGEIVRRHETLRTIFPAIDGQPVQFILSSRAMSLHIVDIGGLIERDSEDEALEMVSAKFNRQFNLDHWPLLRLTLLRLSQDQHVLLLAMHHIVGDRVSVDIFLRELIDLYEAYFRLGYSPLPELPLQYADYAVWQRNHIAGKALMEQRDYWRCQLDGASHVLNLPLDYMRPASRGLRISCCSLVIPESVSGTLRRAGQREGFTPFMTLVAAFGALLWRYSGQEDFLIGMPIAGRTRAETESLIGCFANTLALRLRVRPDISFLELLLQVKEVCLGAYEHQEIPFEELVEELCVERNEGRHPLFQVVFNLLNKERRGTKFVSVPQSSAGLRAIPLDLPNRTANFDWNISITELKGKLKAEVEYDADLFLASTVERMLNQYIRLLQNVLVDMEWPLWQVPILSERERKELLYDWNNTTTAYPKDYCVHQLFESQVNLTPDAVAVVYEDDHLTYGELNRRANQLARRMRALGLSPDSPIALYLDRSRELIVCILGALKAGGAYVPLDTDSPPARLSLVLEEVGAKLVLTRSSLASQLPGHKGRRVEIDSDWNEIARESCQNPPVNTTPDNLIYVMFTSGTAGIPKGIGVPHRAVVRLVCCANYLTLTTSDCIAHISNVSFDAVTFELWGALLHGGRSVCIDKYSTSNPRQLARLLQTRQISTLFVTTALFNQVVSECDRAFAGLEQVLFGGEVVDARRVRDTLIEGVSPRRLVHVYGPTESTTFATWHEVRRLSEGSQEVPIGRPISNTRAYVLGAGMSVAPIGSRGEICLGGEGLARGYYRRPELTAENFVPDCYGYECGGRLYRTGDVARFNTELELEFVGRVDQQVKVRGFRIELSEVEEALRKQKGVKEAVVMAGCRTGTREMELVAYVVMDEVRDRNARAIRQGLADLLPEYMLPARFIEAPNIPVTENGKIDRRKLVEQCEKLEEVETGRGEGSEGSSEALTPVEEVVEGVWAEMLQLMKVGVEDNFFDLGGHSLLASQVVNRLCDLLHIEIPLSLIFKTINLRELAKGIEELMRGKQSLKRHPIARAQRDTLPPLSFAQQRLWFLHRMDPDNAAYNITIALRIKGQLDVPILEKVFNEIIRRHEVLRTGFPSRHGQPIQVIHSTFRFTLPVEDLSNFPVEEGERRIRELVSEYALAPFDLAQALLLRARLLQLSDEKHVLIIVMHHIITDGWSQGIFIREMITLYEAFSNDAAPPLPELTIQYGDFAHWQRQWLNDGIIERQLSYWKRQLNGAPALLDLPTDRRRPAVRSSEGARYRLYPPQSLREELKLLSRREGGTLFMTLLAGFKALLFRYTGQEDIVVGSPTANRQTVETENLIGFFVNTLALRTNLSGDPCVRELLRRVREMALAAYAHQDMPFEQLVDELHVEREISITPLFQVWFALQNANAPVIRLPGVTFEAFEFDNKAAQFDLTFSIKESERGFDILIEYSTRLFDQTTIRNMGDHFQNLLGGIVSNPAQRLTSLPLLNELQRHQLVIEWNDTVESKKSQRCLHQLYEEQARRTPEAIALSCQEGQVSYAELDWRANQLARQLVGKGVCADILVGLYFLPGIELVVAILGVLKAGGAYLTLDSASLKERLIWMLRDAGAKLILTQQAIMRSLPDSMAEVMCLDTEWPLISRQSGTGVTSEVSPDNLAYVIYTSGSTGAPKGVMITHRGVCNLIPAQIEAFCIGPSSRVLQFASLSFDASVSELYTALCSGACLRIAQKEFLMPGSPLLSLIEEESITTLTLPPTALRAMPAAELPCLETLVSAGEMCAPELIEKWSGRGRLLLNAYGPTEVSVCATMSSRQSGDNAQVPIGRPIRNTKAYVLGRRGELLPRGAVGELGIGGEGVARGYLGRPEQTAEKFAPDPMSVEQGTRLYLSGDLCRLGASGELECIGRGDYQVKVRGCRVEPAEIEKYLESHERVREAIVIAKEDGESGKRLIAYVALVVGATPSEMRLRAYLRRKAPEYMIPSAFVFLDSLPRLSNGKIDRRGLAEPDLERPDLETLYVEPRTQLEINIARIWRHVLQIEKVGANNNFFELGGHSLQMVQVLDRLREIVQRDLSIVELFTYPTIRTLADYLTENRIAPLSPQSAYDRAKLRKANPITRKDIRRETNPKAPKNKRDSGE